MIKRIIRYILGEIGRDNSYKVDRDREVVIIVRVLDNNKRERE